MSASSTNITNYNELPGAIDTSGLWYIFPSIVTTDARNKRISWTIKVGVFNSETERKVQLKGLWDTFISGAEMDEKYSAITKVDSMIGDTIKASDPTYTYSGKNLGKANQTNVFTQALKDAYSKYKKQKDNKEENWPRPMLAQKYEDVIERNISWPMYIQKKYDGIRAMTAVSDGHLVVYSRNLKPILGTPLRVTDAITQLYGTIAGQLREKYNLKRTEVHFDGELYSHGTNLQEHGFLRKKGPSDENENLRYIIYDVYIDSNPSAPYEFRYNFLKDLFLDFGKDTSNLFLADTKIVADIDSARTYQAVYVASGFEGAMLRKMNVPYDESKNARHSTYLLKLKPRYDSEFMVIGFSGGESSGKEAGAIMIICETSSGREFTVQPALPLDQRKRDFIEYSNNPDLFNKTYYGKMVTVYYDDMSRDGIPLRGKTKMVIRGTE